MEKVVLGVSQRKAYPGRRVERGDGLAGSASRVLHNRLGIGAAPVMPPECD